MQQEHIVSSEYVRIDLENSDLCTQQHALILLFFCNNLALIKYRVISLSSEFVLNNVDAFFPNSIP